MLELIPGENLSGVKTDPIPVEDRLNCLGTLCHEMLNTLFRYKKFNGIAAPQLGVNLKVFAIKFKEHPGKIAIIFNPFYSFAGRSDKKRKVKEISLSFPLQLYEVPRYKRIRAQYENEKGEMVQCKMVGESAYLFQQLTDVINGVTIKDLGV